MKHPELAEKRLAALTAISAAGLAAVCGVSGFLMAEAMNRREPKLSREVAQTLRKNAIPPQYGAGVYEAQEHLRNTPHQTVTTEGYDHAKLVGHWFPCAEPKRIILAVHGWRSFWWRDFGPIANFWVQNGCSVLYIEQRAQGDSEGDYIGFGMLERYDCLDWLQWLNENGGKELPIYLAGLSMGATTVLMTSDQALPKNVRGIMADCGFTSPAAIWHKFKDENLHLHNPAIDQLADRYCNRKTGMHPGSYSTVDALKNSRVPVLLIHGEADRFVPVEMTLENYAACTAPKELLLVPNAGHAMSYVTAREEYEAAVKRFWQVHDKGIAGSQSRN